MWNCTKIHCMEVSLFHADTRQERDDQTCSRYLHCERTKHVTLNASEIFSDFLNIKQWKFKLSVPVAARLLRLLVRIPLGAWMSVYYECCVLSGRGLYNALITRPQESYGLWCVVVCELENSRMMRPWPALGRSATWGVGDFKSQLRRAKKIKQDALHREQRASVLTVLKHVLWFLIHKPSYRITEVGWCPHLATSKITYLLQKLSTPVEHRGTLGGIPAGPGFNSWPRLIIVRIVFIYKSKKQSHYMSGQAQKVPGS